MAYIGLSKSFHCGYGLFSYVRNRLDLLHFKKKMESIHEGRKEGLKENHPILKALKFR